MDPRLQSEQARGYHCVMASEQRPPISFVRKLCAQLSEQEVEEAERRFWEFLEICRDIVLSREEHDETAQCAEKAKPRFDNLE
jgi:hypothetical protein